MKNIAKIPIGNIGFAEEDKPHTLEIERKVFKYYLKYHWRFEASDFSKSYVRVGIDTSDQDKCMAVVLYDQNWIESFKGYTNKTRSRKYYDFWDWVAKCQELIAQQKNMLLELCELHQQGALPYDMIRQQFRRGNFDFVQIDYGNSEFFN